jgi:hypothetical protein
MEAILSFIKTLSPMLATIAEVLIIVTMFIVALSLISGFWIAMLIIKRKTNYIAEISIFPPRITFHPKPINEHILKDQPE